MHAKTLLASLLCCLALCGAAEGQAVYAGKGPGSYIQVGAAASAFHTDYGQRTLGGVALFVDANLYRRIGVELEARTLRFNEDEGIHETTYLVGPRISVLPGRFRPYVKVLAGRGEFYFPFQYAKGCYFVVAPGAGVDWQIGKSRFVVRILDVEYQDWPGFSFGSHRPFGASSGIAFRVF